MRLLSVAAVCFLALAVLLAPAVAAEPLKSGPQAGEDLAGPFHPLNINGSKAGQKNCLYCSNGDRPVAMIFARECSEPLTKLIKEIDQATAKNKDAKMGSFVVFLSDSQDLEDKLKEVAKKENLEQTVLSIDNPAGPKGYNVSKDADVTVVLYKERNVKVNRAFRKGELKDKDVEQIVKDISKIVPKE
jgi:hypothetical protein